MTALPDRNSILYQIHREKISPSVTTLIAELDAYQNALYPAASNHCVDLSGLDNDNLILMVVRDRQQNALGCGALLLQPDRAGELKRIFIQDAHRSKGLAGMIIRALEQAARDSGHYFLRLETGIKQQAAISLYEKHGYQRCEPFPPYDADPLSVFMSKRL